MQEQEFDSGRLLSDTSRAITVKRVFGKPYKSDGVTIIPAARVGGGFGGGGGRDAKGNGSGFGMGFGARPVGAFVIQDGKVRWKAALDLNTVVLRTQILVAAAVVCWRGAALVRRRR